ncbi:MAG: hypothetical protein ABR936_16950 [Bacteroidota bacterium]
MQQETLTEGLAYIYEECIPETKQLMFRQAIGDVLRVYGNDEDNFVLAFNDLIYLISRIKANESLSSLLPTVGTGRLGKLNPDILYCTFAILRSLAPSVQAYKTAFDLINCRNFDEGYLFEAMNILVACEPSKACEIVLELETRLHNLRKEIIQKGEVEKAAFNRAANIWAEQMLSSVPMSWIKDIWLKFSHSPDRYWLFEYLFNNKKVPVAFWYDPSTNEYSIENRSRKVVIEISEEGYWTWRHLEKKVRYEEVLNWSGNLQAFLVSKKYPMSEQNKIFGNGIYSHLSKWELKKTTENKN